MLLFWSGTILTGSKKSAKMELPRERMGTANPDKCGFPEATVANVAGLEIYCGEIERKRKGAKR